MPNDPELARVFAERLNIDGLHAGLRVVLAGEFESIPFSGVARLAASDFRFIVRDVVGLVALLPEGVHPEPGAGYTVTGILKGVGELGLFPGIEIDDLKPT